MSCKLYFIEFSYVITGPHINDEGEIEDYGIPSYKHELHRSKRDVVCQSPAQTNQENRNLATLSELTLNTEDGNESSDSSLSRHEITVDVLVERVTEEKQ